ncbi:hypothetical protein SO802_026454 [Lithocarpus litseifolius]|uniref:Uncharacterized protein n=1 Tax=Lithocarpus litseifolius TaxID=425828 RepID=A0AAW2C2Y3_9ROSI
MTIDPGPIDRSVLTEQVKHRSELLWNLGRQFIKKALEDVDEVDRIDVAANDEAVNQTEIPDVGPSTSSAALVTHYRPAPTPPLATETPVPPMPTPKDTTKPPMPPIPPIDTGSPLWFTHAEFESSPHTTTIDHNSPMAPSYSSP